MLPATRGQGVCLKATPGKHTWACRLPACWSTEQLWPSKTQLDLKQPVGSTCQGDGPSSTMSARSAVQQAQQYSQSTTSSVDVGAGLARPTRPQHPNSHSHSHNHSHNHSHTDGPCCQPSCTKWRRRPATMPSSAGVAMSCPRFAGCG
jgi:hypothetical protein